jgi:hypothetical protein
MDIWIIRAEALIVTRWFHYLFAILWLGHLYYLCFVLDPFLDESDARTRARVGAELVPRVLSLIRWGAVGTIGWGLLGLALRIQQDGWSLFLNSHGVPFTVGMTMAFCMGANAWFVMGRAAQERSRVAARVSALFSIPVIFFMSAIKHLPFMLKSQPNYGLAIVVLGGMIGAVELGALKARVTPLSSPARVLGLGAVFTLVLYGALELIV